MRIFRQKRWLLLPGLLVLGASLPLLNRLWLPAGSGGMVRGDYTTQDGTQVYVSSGVGLTKLPLRFLCPPEIVCVTFEPAV